MKSGSLIFLVSAAVVASGCGSRTSEDDIRGYYGIEVSVGGTGGFAVGGSFSGIGGWGTGATVAAGGLLIGVGGTVPSTGGAWNGTGGLNGTGLCCEVSHGTGCVDPVISACVCAVDSFCCTTEWDQPCVETAVACGETCGGTAGAGGAPSAGGAPATGGAPGGDCCLEHSGAGCEVPDVQACVCATDRYCCDTSWDGVCAAASESCGANCSVGSGGAPGVGGAPSAGGAPGVGGAPSVGGAGGAGGSVGTESCCDSHGSLGCENRPVQDCVCGNDSFCCERSWDQFCVNAASACGAMCESGAGGAPGAGGTPGAGGAGGTGGANSGDCCSNHGSVGCDQPDVEACVCSEDSYCCQSAWDDLCVNQASSCGAMCMGDQPTEEQCAAAFPDACENCLCNNCSSEQNACLGNIGCRTIFDCISDTGCTGIDCYAPSTCQNVIDLFGGLAGTSVSLAFEVVDCAQTEGCPCP
jgi:hypothetical protein